MGRRYASLRREPGSRDAAGSAARLTTRGYPETAGSILAQALRAREGAHASLQGAGLDALPEVWAREGPPPDEI